MSIILLELKKEKRKKDLPNNNKPTDKPLALNDFISSDTTDTIIRSSITIINVILYNNNNIF